MGSVNQEKNTVKMERKALERRGYICRRLLGEGAFSRVYLVEEPVFGTLYACKAGKNAMLARREADAMAKVHHPLFPQYHDLWQDAESSFLLMEYLPGSSMEEVLRRRGGFSPGQTVRAGVELAEGLCCLHGEGLLFRDVKPANILVRQDGRVGLVDFGCVCALWEGMASRAGSPGFAAPEQLREKESWSPPFVPGAESPGCSEERNLTTACDVYALGQTLKAMLGTESGRHVPSYGIRTWWGTSVWKWGVQGTEGRLRKSILRVLENCTRKEAAERIPDMEGVLRALRPLMREDRGMAEGFRPDVRCRKSVFEAGFSCRER